MSRWGVMLVSYRNMGVMNMWCNRSGDGVPVYSSKEEAYTVRNDYERRNPNGFYDVFEVPSDIPVKLIQPTFIKKDE